MTTPTTKIKGQQEVSLLNKGDIVKFYKIQPEGSYKGKTQWEHILISDIKVKGSFTTITYIVGSIFEPSDFNSKPITKRLRNKTKLCYIESISN